MCKMTCQGATQYIPAPRGAQICRLVVTNDGHEQLHYPATVDLDTGLVTVTAGVVATQGRPEFVIEFQPPGHAIQEFIVMSTRNKEGTWQVTWDELEQLRQIDAGVVRGTGQANAVEAPQGYVVLPLTPTDEMIRRMLATHMPASFKHYLRHPDTGPSGAARDEQLIAAEIKRYAALIEGAQRAARGSVVAVLRTTETGGTSEP